MSPRKRTSGQTAVRLLLVVLLLGLALVFTIIVARDYIEVQEVPLPDFIGLDVEAAQQQLAGLDLVPITFPETRQGAVPGAVTSQSPSAGTMVRQGRTVSLGVHMPPQDARAPVLIGLSAEAALALAREENLNLGQIEYEHNNAPAGIVISQQPEPGSVVDPFTGLQVVVSRGLELPPVQMPSLVGQMLDQAEQQLRGQGFVNIVRVATGTTSNRPGSVLSQQPAAGETVERSALVSLGYGLAADVVVTVPNVIGQAASTAQAQLRNAGLVVGTIGYTSRPDLSPGSVVETNPAQGSYTLSGTPVRMVVNGAEGSVSVLPPADQTGGSPGTPGLIPDDLSEPLFPEGELGSRNVPFEFDPASQGIPNLLESAYGLRVVVEDERGERTVLERTVPAGDAISTNVIVYGDAMIRVYVNDIFYMAWSP